MADANDGGPLPIYPTECHPSILTELALVKQTLSRLVLYIEGNGKPGIIQEIVDLRRGQDAINQRVATTESNKSARFSTWISILNLILLAIMAAAGFHGK